MISERRNQNNLPWIVGQRVMSCMLNRHLFTVLVASWIFNETAVMPCCRETRHTAVVPVVDDDVELNVLGCRVTY